MAWDFQKARWGYYELQVWKELVYRQSYKWVYAVDWSTETARTTVGRGSEKYDDVHDAREAAILHLSNILSKPQSERLLAEQSELAWEPWFDPSRR